MTARPCRWCSASLRACVVKLLNSGRGCCAACSHETDTKDTP